MYLLSDYEYILPPDRIAQTAVQPPEAAKLLVYEPSSAFIHDLHIADLPSLLDPQTLIIFNDSKVVKARILFPQLEGELLFLEYHDPYTFHALVKPGKKRKVGMSHTLPQTDISFTVQSQTNEGRIVVCTHPIMEVMETYGHLPLPPYIAPDRSKEDDYQPIVANQQKPGSVAAPTAALHFTQNLLDILQKQGHLLDQVTLHIGMGTFKSVDVTDITTYHIHPEQAEVDYMLFDQLAIHKQANLPVLAIGTTSTRTLESMPYVRVQMPEEQKDYFSEHTRQYRDELTKEIVQSQAMSYIPHLQRGDNHCFFGCELYIYPGFQFQVIDQLITNFHLPKSSLLMLVAGFIGYEQMRTLYTHALADTYRFFSFGDAMFLKRK